MKSYVLTNIAIVGAGGHCRSVMELLREKNMKISSIYDASYIPGKEEKIMSVPVSGNIQDAQSAKESLVLAVGDNLIRRNLFEQLGSKILRTSIISEYALVRDSVVTGNSNLVFPMAFINAECRIGNNNIINSKALLEHECNIGDHCHISVGAVLSGRVSIGNNCFIGVGAVIKDKISICDDVIIGAGAVVIKNITEAGVYIGNPLKKLK